MAHDINATKTIEQESVWTNGIPSPGRTDITADFLHTFGDVVLRDASGAQHLDRLSLLTHSSMRQRKPERHSRIVRSLLEQLGKQRERLAVTTQNPVHLCHSENAGQIGRVRLGGTRIVIERTEEVGPCHLRRRLQLVRDRLLMHGSRQLHSYDKLARTVFSDTTAPHRPVGGAKCGTRVFETDSEAIVASSEGRVVVTFERHRPGDERARRDRRVSEDRDRDGFPNFRLTDPERELRFIGEPQFDD